MIVTITESVRLRLDTGVWMIETRRVVGEGRSPKKASAERVGVVQWDVSGYYGTLSMCARALMDRHLALLLDDDTRTLQGLLSASEAAWKRIEAACATRAS